MYAMYWMFFSMRWRGACNVAMAHNLELTLILCMYCVSVSVSQWFSTYRLKPYHVVDHIQQLCTQAKSQVLLGWRSPCIAPLAIAN